MSWRTYTDWAKKKHVALRLADALGRGRGRMRWFDSCNAPPPAPSKPDLQKWDEHELAAAWIGHATVLLRMGGMNLITDPVLSNRVGVGLGLVTGGPRRQVAPALSVRELPPLDLILISHAHFDHLDRPTLARLPKRAHVVTATHTRDLLDDLGFRRVTELAWGQSVQIGSLKITAQEVRHWGARTFYDRHRGFNAYLLEAGGADGHSARRVLYGGDTAYQDNFRDVGKVDLAIVGIGAYDPYIQAHATPEQAWAMANHVEADFVIPMHHSTFKLSHERRMEPIERMVAVAGDDAGRIAIRQVGGVWIAPDAVNGIGVNMPNGDDSNAHDGDNVPDGAGGAPRDSAA